MSESEFNDSLYLRLKRSVPNIYGIYPNIMRSVNLSKGGFVPYNIRGFEVNIKTKKNKNVNAKHYTISAGDKVNKFVAFDIKKASGNEKNRMINLENIYPEDYFDGIPGNEEILKKIRFTSEYELNKHRIDDPFRLISNKVGDRIMMMPMVFCHHIGNCECDELRRCIDGIIKCIDLWTYWPQMSPIIKFEASHPNEQKFNGWIYPPQISKDGIYRSISAEDIGIFKVRKCIEMKSKKYLSCPYITSPPLDLQETSVFYGKPEKVQHFRSLLNDSSYHISKLVTYQYLDRLIKDTFILKVDPSTTDAVIAKTRAYEKSLINNATYIDELCVKQLLLDLKDDSITNFGFSLAKIRWSTSVDWIQDNLNISNVIIKSIDNSEIRLSPDSEICFAYERESSRLYIESFSYFQVNGEVVNAENEQKQHQ